MFFGQKLKELRLKYAKMGMRNFSIEMGMGGAEYHALERGFTPPPKDKEWMHNLLEKLQIPPWSEDEMGLYICWKKPFVMQLMDEDVFITHALMTDGSSGSLKKLKEVSDWMRDIAVEHNKKAREYNESR
jgi:hypothetical protein